MERGGRALGPARQHLPPATARPAGQRCVGRRGRDRERDRERAPRWPGGSSGGQRCPAAAVLHGGCCRGAADPAPREAVKQQGRREEPPGTFCRRWRGCPPAVSKSACVSLAAPGRKPAARVLALGSSPAGGRGGSPQKLRQPLGYSAAWRLPETPPALPSLRESCR